LSKIKCARTVLPAYCGAPDMPANAILIAESTVKRRNQALAIPVLLTPASAKGPRPATVG
jgi:hypothetical protein